MQPSTRLGRVIMKIDVGFIAGVLRQELRHRDLQGIGSLFTTIQIVLGLGVQVPPDQHTVQPAALVDELGETVSLQPLDIERDVPA